MNEKNDLMKNIDGNDGNSLRKYLILGGGLFVLFVIGIVAAKFMFSNPKQTNDTKVILPTDIKDVNNKDTKLFNDIPIENENNTQQNVNVQKDNTQFQKPEIKDETPQAQETKQEVKKETKPVATNTQTVQPKEEKVVVTSPKKEIKTKQKAAVAKNYYIQVAAVTRGKPAQKFLNLIKKNGFTYKIEEVKVNGMKVRRVLIGGYTYKEVKKVLPKVKAKISSSAFIKRLK